MTALVAGLDGSLFERYESPTAGNEARKLKQSFLEVLFKLKTDGALTSGVFNDLHDLAHECDVVVNHSATFDLAQRFLLALPANVIAPELDLDNDGEVVFDWKGSLGRMMTITLREDGHISYAARFSSHKSTSGTDQFSDAIPSDVLGLVYRITKL